MTMLSFEGASFGYGDNTVLNDVGFAVAEGELVGVLGPNGSGKTTLVRAATNVVPARSGRVLVQGRPVAAYDRRELARSVAVVPQEGAPVFPFTVLETVLMGRAPWMRAFAFEGRRDVEIAGEALSSVDATALRDRDLSELSGGERQRVVIARALAQSTSLVLADEPTAHLDLRHAVAIFALLRSLVAARQLAVMLVTHDVNLAAMHCDRLVLLAGGGILSEGPPERIVTREILSEAYQTPVHVEHRADGTPFVVPDPAT